MDATKPPAAGRGSTPLYLRVVFGLAAIGMTFQWFDRLGQWRAGVPTGWRMVWEVVVLCCLPLGAAYFAYRAAGSEPSRAEPGAAPDRGRM